MAGTYLSQVPQESDLFLDAQRLRLHNYSLAPSERLAKAIFDSLDDASILNPIYYRFKLELSPNLSYSEIASLYEEFEMRHNNLFDFTNIKSHINLYQGVYTEFNLNDVVEIPECILLFLSRELTAADNECLLERKAEVLDRYDMLERNIGGDTLTNLRWVLALDPSVKANMEKLRNQSNHKCIK